MSDNWAQFWTALVAATTDRDEAINKAYQKIENDGRLSKVTVHRYLCRRGCALATVIRLGTVTIARTRDYKFSPGKNLEMSVEPARRKNTLDGDRHWPGSTFDVERLAEWGGDAAMDANCSHGLHSLRAVDVLATVQGVRPGHPGKPTMM